MAIFNVSDLKVVVGWVFALLLSFSVYLYQSDQKAIEKRQVDTAVLIKENHQSVVKALEKKEKDFKEVCEKQNTKFREMVKDEVSNVTKQMAEFKIDQRVFISEQKEIRKELFINTVDIAKLKVKANIGGN